MRGWERAGPWLVLLCALPVCVPIWVSAVDAVSAHWIPLGDEAFTSVRAWDVLTIHPPLTGQWSSGASAAAGAPTYSPGPLLFWLLALPVRLPWQSSLQLVMAIVNTAALVGSLFLARRRGGDGLLLATAILIPVMLASLPGETYADVWNSSVALMPLVLLVFLAWSVACGDAPLLPVMVVVASFIAQAHLTFVAPALGLAAVGLVGFGFRLLKEGSGPRTRHWIVVAVALGAVCWLAPALDQLVHRPGNAVLVARSARADVPRLGLEPGWHALVHTVGVVPWWLSPPRDANSTNADLATVSTASALSALLVLGGLVAALGLGLRRRKAEIVAASALGLVLCASIMSVAASTPKSQWFTLSYTLRWASPAGMCVWILLGWALLALLPAARRLRLPRLAIAGGVVAVAGASLAVALAVAPTPKAFEGVRQLAGTIEARIPPSRTILVQGDVRLGTAFALADVQGGIVGQLRRDGRKVVLTPADAQGFGNRYVGPPDTLVWLQADHTPETGTLLAEIHTPDLLTRRTRSVYASIQPIKAPQASLRPSR